MRCTGFAGQHECGLVRQVNTRMSVNLYLQHKEAVCSMRSIGQAAAGLEASNLDTLQ
jgi:hypothetical protein